MVILNRANKYYNRGKQTELHVINDVSLELPVCGMVAIFGKSGCGKTTLLNAIGGLDRIDSGSITLFGQDIKSDTDALRNKYVGYIFQNYNLSKSETVFENVASALRLCGLNDENEIGVRVRSALKNVGMEKFEKRLPDTLSGGQQQRVAIARAIVKSPAVILADEPTGNLDESNTVLIMDILKRISKKSLVILVTHEAELVDFYCDRIIEIVDGAVNDIRVNDGAEGYVQRDKNDIYLGELSRSELEAPQGVKLEYYGEPVEELKLRVVNYGGKLYLKCDTPSVKILDDTAEIRLRDGVYETEGRGVRRGKTEGNADKEALEELPPVEGKHYGRLFSFCSSLASGWREYFSKKKKSAWLFRVCLVSLSFVTVFMSASFAVGIRDYGDIRKEHSPSTFYLPLTSVLDTSPISDSIGRNGIAYARIVRQPENDEYFSFRLGNFMTATANSITVRANILDVLLAENKELLCGSRSFSRPLDALVTSAVADEMIKNAGMSFIDEYSDLLNMEASDSYYSDEKIRIIGVVASSEKAIYLKGINTAKTVLGNQYSNALNVTAESLCSYNGAPLIEGEQVAVLSAPSYADSVVIGSKVTVMGKTYTVASVEYKYTDETQYELFVKNKYGIELLDYSKYLKKLKDENGGAFDAERAGFIWLYDYYSLYMEDFLTEILASEGERAFSFGFWLFAKHGDPSCLSERYCSDYSNESRSLAALEYKKENGEYPDSGQLDAAIGSSQNKYWDEYYSLEDQYYYEYDRDVYGSGYYYGKNYFQYVMSDADYTALAYTTGECSADVCGYDLFETYEYADGSVYYPHYMLIYAYDIEEAERYLSSEYGDSLMTPKEKLDLMLKYQIMDMTVNLVSLGTVIALICLCIYLIMRSSVMSRVKEIGIYRAIGVSKRNLLFKFLIEAVVLTTCSVFVGYVIASGIIMRLANVSLLETALYFPFWLALALLVLLYAVTALFGVLPLAVLLRKTPSEILAKYDI